MKRTAFKPKRKEGPTSPREAKPKACAAQGCDRTFIPRLSTQTVCGRVACAVKKVKADFKARKEADTPRSKLEAQCRTIVQKMARIRDRDDGCISCHLPATWGGQWHGSHFRSHGAASAVQFHLWNIHKACSSCNRDKGGNIHEYRPRLIAKIGQDKVDWLMAQNATFKPPVEYYARFKTVMGRRLRRMEKRL